MTFCNRIRRAALASLTAACLMAGCRAADAPLTEADDVTPPPGMAYVSYDTDTVGSAQVGGVELSCAFGAGISQEEAQAFGDALYADALKLTELTALTPLPQLAVVVGGGAEVDGGGQPVALSLDELETDNYREKLVKGLFGVTAPWIVYGAAGYLSGKEPVIGALKAFYGDDEHLTMLDMFDVRFHEDFNSEAMLAYQRDSAVALFTYAEQNGMTLPDEAPNAALVNGWLASIGLEQNYAPAYDYGGVEFAFSSTDKWPLVVKSKVATYHLRPIAQAQTADWVAQFLDDSSRQLPWLLDYLKTNAPNCISPAWDVYNMMIYVGDTTDKPRGGAVGWGSMSSGIHLSDPSVYLHEAVHVFLGKTSKRLGELYYVHWLTEGMADYLSLSAARNTLEHKQYFSNSESWLSGNSGNSHGSGANAYVMKLYREYGGKLDSAENMDLRMFFDLYALSLQNGSVKRAGAIATPMKEMFLGTRADEGAEELSYIEAHSFVGYLVDTYTLDTVISAHYSYTSFYSKFGVSYRDAKAAWLAGLEAKYGAD